MILLTTAPQISKLDRSPEMKMEAQGEGVMNGEDVIH